MRYFSGSLDELNRARESGQYPSVNGKRESQVRKRPGSLLDERFDGFLRFPVASCDCIAVPVENPKVSEQASDADFGECGPGYTLVNVSDEDGNVFLVAEAESDWKQFRQAAETGIEDSLFKLGSPLFLDHYDPDMENVRHLGLSDLLPNPRWFGNGENALNCIALAGDPQVLIDETGMRFDKGRWGASATVHAGLRGATAAVHARVLEKMPPLFHSDKEYLPSKTYREDYASALASMEKALRQSCHVDTYKEGFSVLVAVDSDFRLVVFKNSLQLIRRVAELWEIFKSVNEMRPNGSKSAGEWWDYCCWRQLRKEGWGTKHHLEPVTLVIPKGHALIFSSWLLHAGAEWQEGDVSGYNRMHFYFTKEELKGMTSVFMQDREGVKPGGPEEKDGEEKDGVSFSPALHFLPVPEESGASAPLLPQWIAASTKEKLKTLRPRPASESGGAGRRRRCGAE